ncbi:MAG: hypothetical protein C0490_20760, partial [Marivirga sp.]|nr:hypothetical protein [Marivirga sp.]
SKDFRVPFLSTNKIRSSFRKVICMGSSSEPGFVKIVVVNLFSSGGSESEILAGSLQDNRRIIVRIRSLESWLSEKSVEIEFLFILPLYKVLK